MKKKSAKATQKTKPKEKKATGEAKSSASSKASAKSAKKGSKNTVTKQLSSGEHSSCDNESDAQCPVCGTFYLSDDTGTLWVSCDQCGSWLDFKCSGLKNSGRVPNTYYCPSCLNKN